MYKNMNKNHIKRFTFLNILAEDTLYLNWLKNYEIAIEIIISNYLSSKDRCIYYI